jgi:hypothetical protein
VARKLAELGHRALGRAGSRRGRDCASIQY